MSQPITDYRNELKLALVRLAAVEREVAQLRRRPLPQLVGARHVRLCKTMSDSTYPSEADGKAFEFVYIEQSFTKAQGTQTTTTKERSTTAQGVGKAADEAYIPEDTICLAVEQANGCTILVPLECG